MAEEEADQDGGEQGEETLPDPDDGTSRVISATGNAASTESSAASRSEEPAEPDESSEATQNGDSSETPEDGSNDGFSTVQDSWMNDRRLKLAGIGVLVLAAVVAVLVLYTAPADAPAPVNDTGNDTVAERNGPATVADVTQAIHEEVVAAREQFGRSPLQHNALMARIAKNHSRDMAARDYVSPETPEGRDVHDRYAAGGFTCEIRTEFFLYDGDSIVAAVNVSDPLNATTIAERVVDQWRHDFDARETLKKPYWEQHGIGVVRENNTLYVTQDLC